MGGTPPLPMENSMKIINFFFWRLPLSLYCTAKIYLTRLFQSLSRYIVNLPFKSVNKQNDRTGIVGRLVCGPFITFAKFCTGPSEYTKIPAHEVWPLHSEWAPQIFINQMQCERCWLAISVCIHIMKRKFEYEDFYDRHDLT